MPSQSLTKPIDGSECRFIISAWISAFDIFDKLEGRRLESPEGVDFLLHSFQASSSLSSTTSSRSSVMWDAKRKREKIERVRVRKMTEWAWGERIKNIKKIITSCYRALSKMRAHWSKMSNFLAYGILDGIGFCGYKC